MIGLKEVCFRSGLLASGTRQSQTAPRSGLSARSPSYKAQNLVKSYEKGVYSSSLIRRSKAAYSSKATITPLVAPEPPKVPTSFVVPVVNLKTGESSETVELKSNIFGAPVRGDLLHQMVVWHLANKRVGLAKAKGRGEVAGSTKKILPQKGSGNARQGSIRAPHRRGSGKAHGPSPKDWSFKLNKRVRKLAMVSALSAKFAQGQLTIVDALDCFEAKTKEAVAMSNKFNWEDGGALIIGGEQVNPKFRMATSNLHHLEVQAHSGLNVYAVLKRKHLVISKDALELLDRHVTL